MSICRHSSPAIMISRREYIARNWATAYDAPAVQATVASSSAKSPDQTPQGMQAFVFNTRKDKISPTMWRVREAIKIWRFDYEWTKQGDFSIARMCAIKVFLRIPSLKLRRLAGVARSWRCLNHSKKIPCPLPCLRGAFENPISDGSGNDRRQSA